MKPLIISGNFFEDARGKIKFNNDFDTSEIKRIYFIENNEGVKRAWQGHKIEKRWFSCVIGSFLIKLIKIDNWDKPSKELEILEFILYDHNFEILHIPSGYVSSIEAIETNSKLMVMADYFLGEIVDEYRFPLEYFK